MTGKRIGALAVAVVLIAGALLLRNSVLDDDADEPTGSTTATTDAATAAGELICITELDAVCRDLGAALPDLDVQVQDAGVTLDSLATLPDDAPRSGVADDPAVPGDARLVAHARTGSSRSVAPPIRSPARS